MSVPVMWIRNNMLSVDRCGRQLTDAELKVQRSLQTLSIPEWYLNKRSDPPKILNNSLLNYSLPAWKNLDWKRTTVTNLNTLATSDTVSSKSPEISESSPSTGTYKVQRHQKSPNSIQQKSPSTTTEKMDTTIPYIQPRRDISKTFPKMSPSRKLHNINIVLDQGPPLKLSRKFDEDLIPDASNYGTYVIIKRKKSAKKNNNDLSKSAEDSESTPQKTRSSYMQQEDNQQKKDNIQKEENKQKKDNKQKENNKQQEDNIQPPEPIYATITPNTKSKLKKNRVTSTPKFPPGCLLSSTIIEEAPKGKRPPSKGILEKLSLFEDSWKDTSMIDDSGKASQSMQDRTSTSKASQSEKLRSASYEETPRSSQRLQNLLEGSIRSIEPIIFETVDSLKSPTSVREIIEKVENVSISESSTPVKQTNLEWRKSMVPAESKDLGESPKTPVQLKKDEQSPRARPRDSRRMSMTPEELKNIVESPKTPVQLKKDEQSPRARPRDSRRMSMTPEELKNIVESPKTPVQLKKDEQSPCARPHNSGRMSMIPEELKNIVESPKTPVQLKDEQSPCARLYKSRRMLMIPEESKNIGESPKTPVQLKKDEQSPCARPRNSRRMSLVHYESKNIEESLKTPTQQRKNTELEADAAYSPSTRFLTSRRKSIELENLVRSKQPPKQKSVVRDIIDSMTARAIKHALLQKQNNVPGAHQNFVKTVVDALEKGNSSLPDETIQESFTSTIKNEDDLGSASESDVKSSSTTVSCKDTESSSDSDQRSPILLESDDSRKTFDFDVSVDTNKASELKHQHDDDSVYWIPVSRCKLPRTSSLLSMMSRLSTNADSSPCVSPIRSDNENENTQVAWGATFRKNRALSRNLFRIDETIVIDSGYSDRSDKSAVCCSVTDSNWSEDTQYESGPEVRKNRITRGSRRRSSIGATFRVSD